MIDAERWGQLQRLLDAALDLPSHERRQFLERECRGDAALLEEASALVEACDSAGSDGGFLSSPAIDIAMPLLVALAASDAESARARSAELAEALRRALAGRYEVGREIGHGGMATVYLAHDIRHDRGVAVKVVERGSATRNGERFLREIRIAAQLTHPHILGVHESGEADGLLYYVMPYVEGETLRARLGREGALAPADAMRLLREIADALVCAHGRGVVHRDLKPENVLLSGGHAVVADFGIARALAASGVEGETMPPLDPSGTPAYMAPEQVALSSTVDHRADLYALGVVAYEVLSGAHPFAGRSRSDMLRAHQTDLPSADALRRPGVPPALIALVMQLLAKDPAARPPHAQAVLRALDAAASPSASGRRRWVLAASVAVLAGALGGFVLWRERVDAARPVRAMAAPAGAAGVAAQASRGTVAVLPFASLGPSATDDYLGDGLTEALTHALSRVPGVRVVGRTSSAAFKGKTLPAQEIGRALDANALITGSVRRSGERVRVAAQLVSAADGKVLWERVFENRSDELFAMEDRFTQSIMTALAPVLGEGRARDASSGIARGTSDQEAYDLYLKGRYYWLQRGTENLERAISHFQQSIDRDPGFARARAGLALAYGVRPVFDPRQSDSAAALTMASARRALAIDSTLADAHLALGIAFEMRLRTQQALEHYRRAAALDPSSTTAHHWLGLALLNLGATDSALAQLRYAAELDPLAVSPAAAVATALLYARRYPEAVIAAHHAVALDSSFGLATWVLGLSQAFAGAPDSAVITLEHGARRLGGDTRVQAALVFAYAAAGRWGDAARVRRQLHRAGAVWLDGSEPAVADLVFGDSQPIIDVMTNGPTLRRFIAGGGVLGCNPLLDPLRADARFREAMRALGVRPCPLVQR